jgi:putative ABC transport system permease protein
MRAAMRQIWRFRLRSVLVLSCAALGVTGAVTAVNYASGGRQQVLDQIRRLGSNVVVVQAQQSRSIAGRARSGNIVTTLVEPDYQALRREVDGIQRSSAVISAGLRLKAGYLSTVAPVYGVEPDYFTIKSWRLVDGDYFDSLDARRASRVALLGAGVARDLYGSDSPVGQRLFINRVPFEVVGVLRERGQGLDIGNEDQQVYVPLQTAMRRLMNVEHYASIVFEVRDWNDMDRVSAEFNALLGERHRVSERRPADFKVQSQKEIVDTQVATSARLGFYVRWIGLSALLVSGLGILAIAWISVRDRTREIGTRRALGATAPDVFFQFAFEAMVLALAGALFGLLVGAGASRIAADRAGMPYVFDVANATLAFAAALALNLVFASGPALRAARLDPIKALRHD